MNVLFTNAGPKAEHLVVCTAQVGLLMTLQFTDNVIAFFVTAVVTGVFRSAMYTIPFMLANEICQKEVNSVCVCVCVCVSVCCLCM